MTLLHCPAFFPALRLALQRPCLLEVRLCARQRWLPSPQMQPCVGFWTVAAMNKSAQCKSHLAIKMGLLKLLMNGLITTSGQGSCAAASIARAWLASCHR